MGNGDGICEMTGEDKMGKSDDEMRKTQMEGATEGLAKDESCEEDVGPMQGDAQLTLPPRLARPISSISRVPISRRDNNLEIEKSRNRGIVSLSSSSCLPGACPLCLSLMLRCAHVVYSSVLSKPVLNFFFAPAPLESADDDCLHLVASSPERPRAFDGLH